MAGIIQNPSKNEPSDARKKRLRICVEILTRWFLKWSACFPNHPISKLQTVTYAESLLDLTAEQIEHGCRRATQEVDQFPKPANIRRYAEELNSNRDHLGPSSYEWDPKLEKERLERKAKWERQLAESNAAKMPAKPWEQQKGELQKKGWIS